MDAEDAIEAAAYAALNVPALTNLSPLFQHVPEDTPPPVTIIGDISSEPIGGKGDTDERASLTIVSVIQGEARKPLMAIQKQIKLLLDGKSLTRPGWVLHFAFAGTDGVLDEDGTSYIGNTRFTVLAFSDA
jgi:hypothetical protein